jgi:phenylalanyl-tRNA synthetase beta chain
MKAPVTWLNDFVPIKDLEPSFIAHNATMTGSKVENITVTGRDLSKIITGEIVELKKHPHADRLSICSIRIPDQLLQIVTGASNLSSGDIVPVALSGAVIAGNKTIQTCDFRGVLSEGMLCSAEELGLSSEDISGADDEGILILPHSTPLGIDIKKVFEMGNAVFEFEITSNRPDCFSIEGLAKEISIAMNLPFTPKNSDVKGSKAFSSKDHISVTIEDPNLCKRYIARVVRDIQIKPSPQWLINRLREAGVRSINNIVDITNYVMIETGQPMHAFDLDLLSDRQIIVRRARQGETMTTLDKESHIFSDSMLVIADSNYPIALAGIMGGENSQIRNETKAILFESASFDGVNVRMTAQKLGIRTESSSRFEKGLDPENARKAINRACELVELLECGEVSNDDVDQYPMPSKITRIPFRPDWINSFLGTEIETSQMISILESIGCRQFLKDSTLYFIPPYYRPDLEEEVDLCEEIARFYGYNNIEPTLLAGKSTTLGGLNLIQKQKESASEFLRGNGFYEACTYSFYGTKSLDKIQLSHDDPLRNSVILLNPLGENFSLMRTSLLPSLLEVATTNFKRRVRECKIFELAKCYFPNVIDSNQLPYEKDTLGGFYYSVTKNKKAEEVFYYMKGILSGLFVDLNIPEPDFIACENHSSFHPGRTAAIEHHGKHLGILGMIHPDVASTFDIPNDTVVFLLDYELMKDIDTKKKTFTALPKYPGVSRDLAITVDMDVASGAIMNAIRESAGSYLEEVSFFDVYTGKQVPTGKKSLAYELVFRSVEETMTDEMVLPIMNQILDMLRKRFFAELR